MILHDFRCEDCGLETEHLIPREQKIEVCPDCNGISHRVILVAAKPDWAGLAQGENASPEAISRFERVHKQQKAKEDKSYAEHGDYGPAPGGAGGVRNLDGSSSSAPFIKTT